ncbi:MAG: glycosyltransferase, partial [Bacteroidales bacterium]
EQNNICPKEKTFIKLLVNLLLIIINVNIIDVLIDNPLWLIPLGFAICFIIQMIYYLGIYSRIIFYKDGSFPKSYPPVSVIICARDEEANLEKNLPLILEQEYPDFEVIVVNDSSTDNSDIVLKKIAQQYPNLRTTEIKKDEKFTHGKKLALTIGIKAAKHEYLLFTDADCFPETKHWIKEMMKNFDKDTSIVLGYGGYKHYPTLLNSLIRFDTVSIALQYFSYALAGFPYMGVGRNLAYRKSLFFANKGFAGHYHVESGDDDIFINQTANKNNTKTELSPNAIIRSEPEKNWNDWLKQKRRHLTTAGFYKGTTKFRLGLEIFSRVLFYVFFVLSLILFTKFHPYIIGLFLVRHLIQLIIYQKITKRLNEKYLLIVTLFYDIWLPFFNFMGIILNKISTRNNKWN